MLAKRAISTLLVLTLMFALLLSFTAPAHAVGWGKVGRFAAKGTVNGGVGIAAKWYLEKYQGWYYPTWYTPWWAGATPVYSN